MSYNLTYLTYLLTLKHIACQRLCLRDIQTRTTAIFQKLSEVEKLTSAMSRNY